MEFPSAKNFGAALKTPRWRAALAIAAASDVLGYGFVVMPLLQWIADAVTALALWVVLGFRWPLLPALAIEVVPGLELFPAWTLAVAALAATEAEKPAA